MKNICSTIVNCDQIYTCRILEFRTGCVGFLAILSDGYSESWKLISYILSHIFYCIVILPSSQIMAVDNDRKKYARIKEVLAAI